ncbi:MAG: hypothetical protein QOF37_478, partial [Thermoleophilaceae bacterium]|nr:hypothetical protein [Thermoleophilaceae bacterium]
GAIMFATSLALLADAYPGAEERTKALAAYGATIGGAFVIGPLAGGALTTGFGWQAVFLVNVPLGVITLVATARWVRESSGRDARRLDWPGQATLSAALFLLVLGLLRGNDQGWTSAPIVAEFAASALLFAAFIAVERRVAAPMLPLSLFRKGTIIGGGLALVSAGLVLGLLAKADSPWTVLLPTLVIGGIGSGVFNPALSMVALSSAPQRMSGLAAGVNDTFRQAGIAVGVAAFGALVPANSALGGGSPTEYVAGMHNALIAGAILAGVGAVASVVLIGASRHGTAAEPALEAS